MSFWGEIKSGLKSMFFPYKYTGDNQTDIAASNRKQAESLAKAAREHANQLQSANHAFTERLRRFELAEQKEMARERMAHEEKLLDRRMDFDRDLLHERMEHEQAMLALGFTHHLLLEAERASNQRNSQVFQAALNNFPLNGVTPLTVLQEYSHYLQSDTPIPFLVIVSPPEVNFESVSSAPTGLPKMETELSNKLGQFLEKDYPMTAHSERPVKFLSGAWRSKAFRNNTASDAICAVFKEVPLLILESEVDTGLRLTLRLLVRDVGQVHTQSKTILKDFDCQALINRVARAETVQWREQRQKYLQNGKLDALKKQSKAIQIKEVNFEKLELEEETAELFDYIPTDNAYQELKRFLSMLHCLLTGMVSDEFFFEHYRVMPKLPHLLPQLLVGFSAEETTEIVQIVRSHYESLIQGLLSQQSPYAAFLAVEVALGLTQLEDKTFAVAQLQYAAEVWLAQQKQQMTVVTANPTVADVSWLEKLRPYLQLADEALLSAFYLCFDKLGSDKGKLWISDQKERLSRDARQKQLAEKKRLEDLAVQEMLRKQAEERQEKERQEKLRKEKGTPLTFSTMKQGKTETFTVYEKVFDIKGVQLVMVYIPEGTLKVGSKTFNLKPFYLGKFPVTQRQYQAVMGENPSSSNKGDNFPAENMYWKDAKKFCQKLSELTKQDFRLPSEAQWEYACRAETTSNYWWGDNIDKERCWYDKNSGDKTHSVGEKVNEHTNPFGLCDMSGNVWEWCQDEWHNDFTEAKSDGTPYGSENGDGSRLLRGGSLFLNSSSCCSGFRYFNSLRYSSFGFRLLLLIPSSC